MADKPDRWIHVTNSDTIQKIIRQWNKEHFDQVLNMPIGDPWTMQLFGWDGDSPTCKKILKGEHLDNLSS